MSIEFHEKSSLGEGWTLEVRQGSFLLGYIRQSPEGIYQYYRSVANWLNPSYENSDLESLKIVVASHF